jgi:nitrous oxidase accessory protein NosD
MRRGALRLVLCLLVAASLALTIGVARAAAATLVVDDDGFATAADCNDPTTPAFLLISLAVAAASPGDTIKVCPGTYNEQVAVNKNNLTLLGAQAGVDARTRPFVPDPTTQSIIQHPCGPVQFMADNIELNGFTVQGSTLPDPCFLAGIWSNPGFSGTNGGFEILNNIVQDNISGIELDSTCTNPTLVQFNLIQNNNNPGPGAGNGIQTNFGLCNAQIDSNKFSGHINSSFLVVVPSTDLDVTNNELVGGTSERIVFGRVSTSTISGNVSMGSTSSATIRLFGGNSSIDINENTLLDGMRGIRVDDPFGLGPNSDIEGHTNCIQGNSLAGLQVDPGGHLGILNAENNWWGSSTGPTHPNNPGGTGDAVIDAPEFNVDYTPWLTSPPGPPCPAPPLPPSGKVTGGGQIDVPGGKGTFGFNAKLEDGAASGHLNYMNHVTRAHLNCTVTAFTVLTATMAKFSGTCDPKSAAPSFMAEVEDNGEPGKGVDKFKITYGTNSEGGTITQGNIQIHSQPAAAAPASAQSADTGATGAGESALPAGATFSGISLSGLEFGTGVSILSSGSATGQFFAVLQGTSALGQPREIQVDGKVSKGSVGSNGSATYSGRASVDLGGGNAPLLDVPFTVTATTQGLLLKLGTSTLPTATLTGGSFTIQ